jgi:hypothetical protein
VCDFDPTFSKAAFASARVLAQHFFARVSTLKQIPKRELGMRKYSQHRLAHSLSPAEEDALVEAGNEILQILHKTEPNRLDGIVIRDES